jgi:Xaa-Pro dipeptidase
VTGERADLGGFAHGQFRVDYEARPSPSALREARLGRARSAMRDAGLDALLVWKNENVRYLTGLRAQIIAGKSALLNGCLLIGDDDPILLASGGEADRCRDLMPWLGDVQTVPIMEARGLVRGAVTSVIADELARAGAGRAPVVGLDEGAFCLFEALGELPIRLADGDAAMQAARRVKLPAELALMQEACAIAEAVTRAAVEAAQPGVRELDVVAEAMHALFRLGGEEAHVTTPFVASGEHMAPPNRIASDKIIRDGDLVFIDIGAQWSGYFGDLGRTIVCGEPSARQREVHLAVYDALAAAIAALVPGSTNRDVEAAVHDAAREHGLEGRFLSLFIGHGVGIGANEPPYIGERLAGDETVVLEERMTFAIEPLIWVPGVRGGAGVRLEDTVVVGPRGGIPLTRAPFDAALLDGDRPIRHAEPALA